MNERSLLALLAFPVLWVASAVMSSSAPPVPSPAPKPPPKTNFAPTPGAQSPKVKQPVQKLKPLKTACDVLSDYFGFRDKGAGPAARPSISFTIQEGNDKASVKATAAEDTAASESCDMNSVRKEIAGNLKTAFVFVPDPTASALALETDRALDAIRLALSRGGFVPYKSNSLPWSGPRPADDNGKKASSDPDESSSLARPGVWLFRNVTKDNKGNYLRDLKLLFLIGDSPTVGISKPQFQNAVDQFKALVDSDWEGSSRSSCGPTYPSLEIVGPIFSGSVDSLAHALKNLCTPDPAKNTPPPHWDVKAISGTAEVPDLQERLKKTVESAAKVELVQIAKQGALVALWNVLKPLGRTAILSEADTVFGLDSTPGDPDDIFHYSHNLLNLRTAYESDKDLMARIFPKSLRPDQLALHFGFTQDPSDAFPSYSPQNLAVSQQLTLRHLASNLHRRHFANLVIVSSDNLDALFLARFFQEESPNLRIALLNSDTLLDREAGSVSLRGVITISQQPTGSVAMKPMEFPNELVSGIYRACRQQLFADVANPNRVISVVGFDGEWPIKVLGPKKEARPPEVSSVWDITKFKWAPPMGAFLILLAWLAFAPVFVYLFPKPTRLTLIPFCRAIANPPDSPAIQSEHWRRRWIFGCAGTGAATFVIPGALGFAAIFVTTRSAEYPALVARYFYFGNGVSPLLPLTALLLAIHACAWSRVRSCYLKSYAFRPAPSPLTITAPHTEKDGSDIELLLKAVSHYAETFFDKFWITVFTAAGITAVVTYSMWVHDIEIEFAHEWSTFIWTPLFSGVGVLAVNASCRIWLLWVSLHNLLRRLEFHPLRVGFTTLPDRVSWTSIWSIAGTRPTMVSLQMSSDYLHAIGRATNSLAASADLRTDIDAFTKSVLQGSSLIDSRTFQSLQLIHTRLDKITTDYIEDLRANNYWSSLRTEGWKRGEAADSSKEKAKSSFPLLITRKSDGSRYVDQPHEDNETPINKLKSQFIALQYAAFIRYAFMQLRNLLGFLVTATSLLFIALNVYPFEPIGTLTNFASFLFTLTAIVVVTIFYQMDRDPLLSRLSNSTAGKLDSGFGWRLAQFGIIPTATFLATHFPPIGQGLVRLVQIIPGLAKL